MKSVGTESVKRTAGMALSVLLVLCLYRADLGVFVRIVATAAIVYGAGALVAKLVVKVWRAARTFADNRKVRCPRIAAGGIVLCVMFIPALILVILSGVSGGRVVLLLIEGSFLLVGGVLVVRRLLSGLWRACSELFHKSPVEGGIA